jgi:oxygen-dependent protoporphyrinogen oxidase
MKKVVIIGAGISGLATAFEIREKAKAAGVELDISILEADTRPGGKMHTENVGGYLCEWGPNGYLDSRVHATDFCKRAGLESELVPASNVVNRRFLFARGKLRVLPDSPPRFFLSGILSIRGRLRIMFEPFRKPAPPDADESVTEFATRRLGREALEMLLDPFVAGVFAGNPDTLSLKSCFPRIHEMEQTYGSLVRALFALRKKRRAEKKKAKAEGKTVAGATAPRGHLTSLKRGMGQLVDALANHFRNSLVAGCEVTSIEHAHGELRLSTGSTTPEGVVKAADAVVLTVPAYQAAKMLSSLAPDAVKPLKEIEYNALWVVVLGYDEKAIPRPLDGYGFLIPRREKRKILGCLWSSSIFPGRAPDGKALLTVMAGGARDPDVGALSEEEILPLVREELRVTMGITAGPDFIRAKRHANAIPQYTIGHALRLADIEKATSQVKGLFLTGNAYRGIAMADCILQAGMTADKVFEYLF